MFSSRISTDFRFSTQRAIKADNKIGKSRLIYIQIIEGGENKNKIEWIEFCMEAVRILRKTEKLKVKIKELKKNEQRLNPFERRIILFSFSRSSISISYRKKAWTNYLLKASIPTIFLHFYVNLMDYLGFQFSIPIFRNDQEVDTV